MNPQDDLSVILIGIITTCTIPAHTATEKRVADCSYSSSCFSNICNSHHSWLAKIDGWVCVSNWVSSDFIACRNLVVRYKSGYKADARPSPSLFLGKESD
jgi:hypothetical protein